jgi:DNA-binding transcriptional regulator GbsR (MarR family)
MVDMSSGSQTSRDQAAERDIETVRHYVESFALVLTQLGMQRMTARVFAALMTTDTGRLTAAELAEQLAVSPAAISGAVRFLEQIGLVTRERDPGARRDHFRLYDDLWYATYLKRDRMMNEWRDAALEGVEVMGEETPSGQRLADMADFLGFMAREIPVLFKRWHAEHQEREKQRHAG